MVLPTRVFQRVFENKYYFLFGPSAPVRLEILSIFASKMQKRAVLELTGAAVFH